MALKVLWTAAAWTDLERAAAYIAGDSPHYAASFVRGVRDAARSLASPTGHERQPPECADPRIREVPVRGYRLIYRVTPDQATILGFVHWARDLSGVDVTRREAAPPAGEAPSLVAAARGAPSGTATARTLAEED